jgi:hypothetical protein
MELDCYAALSVCSTTETIWMDDADQSSSLVGEEATTSTRIPSYTTISKKISKIRSRLSTLIGGPHKESRRQTRRQLSHLDCYELIQLRTTKNLTKPTEFIPRIAHPLLMTQN